MFYILISDRFCDAFYSSTAALEHCTCLFHSDLLKNIPESQSGFLFNIFREIRFGKEKLFRKVIQSHIFIICVDVVGDF